MKSNYRRVVSLIALACIALLSATVRADEGVTVTNSKIKDLNLRIYGFIETDAIADTTEGFLEEMDNNLVPMRTAASANLANLTTGGNATNTAGQNHRSIGSIRNSRLGFDVSAPKMNGLASEAIFEMDFLGNQGIGTNPGAAPGQQTEANFFNNPTVRIRHAYINLTYDDSLNAKLGQYWSLLGWQPYYFPGENAVLGDTALLYRRFVQARVTYTMPVMDQATLEAAADVAKPAEMNSAAPESHAGLRLASTHYKAASMSGASSSMIGLSAGVSAAEIPTATSLGHANGMAYAFDVAVPIIPSVDGKDRGNNLIAMGEFMQGSGVGGLELAGASMGVAQVTNAACPLCGTAIDTGIAGVNLGGNPELITMRSFRYHLQYVLPGGNWAVSSGYAQLQGLNLNHFAQFGTNAQIAAASAISPKQQYGYASLFWDALGWLRFAGEVSTTRDTYNDPNNRFANNERCQLTAFFIF